MKIILVLEATVMFELSKSLSLPKDLLGQNSLIMQYFLFSLINYVHFIDKIRKTKRFLVSILFLVFQIYIELEKYEANQKLYFIKIIHVQNDYPFLYILSYILQS